jgi:hypothetical protein
MHGIREMPAGFDAEVAELFRDLRLAANLDESQLADRLDTQVEVVQALEQGTLYALPPWPETSRVVTAYGQLLNLDVQPLLRRVYAQVEAGVIPEEMPSDSPQTLDFSGSDPYDNSDPYDLGSETYEFEPSPVQEPSPVHEPSPQGASNGLYPDEPSPYGDQGGMPQQPPRPQQPQQNYAPPRPMPPQGAPRQHGYPQGQPQGYPQGQRPPQGMPDQRGPQRPMGPGGQGPGGQVPGQYPGQRPQQPPRPGGPPPQYRPQPGGPQGMPPGGQQGRAQPGGQFRPQPGGAPQAPGGQMPPQPGHAAPPPPPPQDAAWPEAEYAPPPEADFAGKDEKKAGRLKKAIAMIVIVLAAIFVLWLLFSQVGSLFGTGGGPQEEIGQSAEPPAGDAATLDEPADPNDPQNRKGDRLPVPEMPQ